MDRFALTKPYTYCANHPHRNPRKLSLPIGPVFVGDSFGTRVKWKPSPDTEEIRLQLLELLKRRAERKDPPPEYPAGFFAFYLDEAVIAQLAEFKGKRAVEGLKRLTAFDTRPSPHPLFRDNRRTVEAAKFALRWIVGENVSSETGRYDTRIPESSLWLFLGSIYAAIEVPSSVVFHVRSRCSAREGPTTYMATLPDSQMSSTSNQGPADDH